jgi:ketosteroid isomerase-like protein
VISLTTKELIARFIRTLDERDWDAWTATMQPYVIFEIPQTRERIRGREDYLKFNREFPGDWHVRPKRIIADEEHGVVWFAWQVGDAAESDAMAFFVFRDGLISEVTDFWPEPYDPPPGREHLVEGR